MESCTKADYFKVGMDLLADGGHTNVTVAGLCSRLGVTKGSFYHHFQSGPAFLRELLLFWEAGFAEGYERLHQLRGPADRIEFTKHLGIELNHRAEAAIRALARTDDFAREVQQRVTARGRVTLTETLIGAGVPPDRAPLLADVGLTLLIGLQHSQHPEDREHATRVFDEYQRWIEASSAAG
ncbi:MAG: TetR/AcrR family transcriptional regulator [Acidimicrobiales bacterium]